MYKTFNAKSLTAPLIMVRDFNISISLSTLLLLPETIAKSENAESSFIPPFLSSIISAEVVALYCDTVYLK